jgi:membrane protease YdiL (CAAX protease family)
MALGWAIVHAFFSVFHVHTDVRVLQVLPQQFVGYLILFLALAVMLRIEYSRPFWPSLGWAPLRVPPMWVVICGLATFFGVNLLGLLIRTPTTSNPLTDLLMDRKSIVWMGIFGITIAPLSEELLFRGFLQPLLVRSTGLVGILLAALPFGFLHYHEYGNSWRHAVLISLAGVCFGAMRHATGSTKASTLMHAAYNGYIFAVVLLRGGAPL